MQPDTDITLTEQPLETRIRRGLAQVLAFEGRDCTPEKDIISIREESGTTSIVLSQKAWQQGWPYEIEPTDIMRSLSQQIGGSWSYTVGQYTDPQTVIFNGSLHDLARKLDARVHTP